MLTLFFFFFQRKDFASFLCTRELFPRRMHRTSYTEQIATPAGAVGSEAQCWGGQPRGSSLCVRKPVGWGEMRQLSALGPLLLPVPYSLLRKKAGKSIHNKFSIGLSRPGLPVYSGVDLGRGVKGGGSFLQGALDLLVQGGFG